MERRQVDELSLPMFETIGQLMKWVHPVMHVVNSTYCLAPDHRTIAEIQKKSSESTNKVYSADLTIQRTAERFKPPGDLTSMGSSMFSMYV